MRGGCIPPPVVYPKKPLFLRGRCSFFEGERGVFWGDKGFFVSGRVRGTPWSSF